MIGSVQFTESLQQYPGVFEEFDRLYKRLNAFLSTSMNDDGTLIAEAPVRVSSLNLPVGSIVPYSGASAPSGWLMCDGSAVSRSTYATLFDVIGTTYGAGDASTTFNVPNLRQRFPLGKAASGTGSTLGSTGGAIDHTHTGPSHTHTSTTVVVTDGTEVTTHTVATSPTNASGAGNTGSANPPFLAVNYLILFA